MNYQEWTTTTQVNKNKKEPRYIPVVSQISGFLLVLLFPGAIKVSATILLKYICTCAIESGVDTALILFKLAVNNATPIP